MRQSIENVRILTILTALLLTFSLQAKELPGKRNNRISTSVLAKVEDCNPPIAYTEFALNNVRFGLEAGGQIWENNGDAAYSIPKVDLASGEIPIHSLYAGALWLGGYSPDGQLKLAAVTYRTGGATDFYNGPLSNDNFATADFCGSYDRHFLANRTDCQVHRAFFSASEEEVEQLFPDGYSIPSYFNDWPGQNLDAIDQGFLLKNIWLHSSTLMVMESMTRLLVISRVMTSIRPSTAEPGTEGIRFHCSVTRHCGGSSMTMEVSIQRPVVRTSVWRSKLRPLLTTPRIRSIT